MSSEQIECRQEIGSDVDVFDGFNPSIELGSDVEYGHAVRMVEFGPRARI